MSVIRVSVPGERNIGKWFAKLRIDLMSPVNADATEEIITDDSEIMFIDIEESP